VSDDAQLRASDAQRDSAAAEIREHYAAGRLSDDELTERLDAVYQARTQGELRELRRDLPALSGDAGTELAERRRRLRVSLIAIIPLVRNGWALYGPGADLDEYERRRSEGREQRREHRREQRERQR
jgi:hypothetical protein